MTRMKNKRKQASKSILVVVMCLTMVLSTLSVGNISHATGTAGDVENTTAGTEENTTAATTTTTTTTTTAEASGNTDANGILGKNSDVGIEVTKSITGKAGKEVKVSFKLLSNDESSIKLKSVYPVIDSGFPFETSGDAYKIVSAGNKTDKQKALSASFKMKVRSDIQTGYHSVRFIGEYTKIGADGTSQDYYVIKTINIYFTGTTTSTPPATSKNTTEEEEEEDDEPDYNRYDDEYDEEDSDSDDDSESEPTAPKLIITGYETVPEKIMAGETFTITIHIQNTSKSTDLCNGKFLIGNEAGSFLPTSGSNAVFVESIKAGKTGDIKIEMKAGADLQQKNYSLVIKGDFDDGEGNNFTSSDSLTLPVYQEISFGITEVSMAPEILGVGSEGALMFTINNKSNVGVYNVNVSANSDAVEAEESYVGNIAGSSSAYATLNLTGVADNTETGTIKVVISYEDSEGNVSTVEQDVECMVSAEGDVYGEDEFYEDEENYEDEEYYEEEEGIYIAGYYVSPVVLVVIILAVLVAIIVVVVLLVRRRKKRMAALLEADDGEDDLYDENF